MARPSRRKVKLMLVDDHHVVRLGLRTLFETVGQVAVVGEASTAAEAVELAGSCRPDVVLLDVRLPDGSGVEVCREIRSRRAETQVIMLTSFGDEEAVIASLLAGAAGYLLKSTDPQRLIEAVLVVAGGGSLLDPEVTQAVLARLRQPAQSARLAPGDPLAELTEQERNILPLIARGKTNREIAGELGLSEHTVKTYVSFILRKLHLARRAEAAAFIASRRRDVLDRGA